MEIRTVRRAEIKICKRDVAKFGEIITVLDENYGDDESRNVDSDLGGYVI